MPRRPASSWILLAIGVSLILSAPARPATLYVAKDGTGAHSTIQEAIDAAAAGDTIRIGAGRYEDFVVHEPPRDGSAILALIMKPDLTIMGVDRDSVVLGPESYTRTIDGRLTFGLGALGEAAGLVVRDFTLENLYRGAEIEDVVTVSGVRFRQSESNVVLSNVTGVVIEDSSFEWTADIGSVKGIASPVGSTVRNTVVRNCEFRGEQGSGVLLDGGGGSLVEGCTFDGITIPVVLYRSSEPAVTIRNNQFNYSRNAGVLVSDGSDATIEDCVFENGLHRGLYVLEAKARVNRCAIRGGDFGAIVMQGAVDVVIRDSDIFNDDGPRVLHLVAPDYSEASDLRYNYWGSQDSTEIASWIDDGADDTPDDCPISVCPRDSVEFWPVLERSVPARKESVGGLKGAFRRPRGN